MFIVRAVRFQFSNQYKAVQLHYRNTLYLVSCNYLAILRHITPFWAFGSHGNTSYWRLSTNYRGQYSYWCGSQVVDIFLWTSHWFSYMSLDLQYNELPLEPNAQKWVKNELAAMCSVFAIFIDGWMKKLDVLVAGRFFYCDKHCVQAPGSWWQCQCSHSCSVKQKKVS